MDLGHVWLHSMSIYQLAKAQRTRRIECTATKRREYKVWDFVV